MTSAAPQCLAAEGVRVTFDGLTAIADLSLEVTRGRITGLIGPNGAGKTTAVNVMSGFQKPSAGRLVMDGEDLGGLRRHVVRRRGLARTFQGGRLFRDLSVFDNLEVTGVGLGLTRREAARHAAEMLDWMGIGALRDRQAGTLPYTDERRVAIGRALMMEPGYLLLDEPAAGMTEPEAQDLAGLVRRIVVDTGCGVLLIEHNIGFVLDLCEVIYVIDSGKVIEHGTADVIRTSETVRHAYMGTAQDIAPASAETLV